MAYDARETLRALEPPTLTVPRDKWWEVLLGLHRYLGPRVYVGRVLSHPQWFPLQQRWAEAEVGMLTDDEATALVRDTCRAMGIPWRVMKRLPGRVVSEALADFLACQVRASSPGQNSATPPRSQHEDASRNGSLTKTSKSEGSNTRQ